MKGKSWNERHIYTAAEPRFLRGQKALAGMRSEFINQEINYIIYK